MSFGDFEPEDAWHRDDPVLELIDSEGVKRLLMGRGDLKPAGAEVVKKDPVFSLVLRGPDGKVVWKTP